MNTRLLELLACPRDGGALSLDAPAAVGGVVEEGTLRCERCGATAPIVRGIPRFVPSDDYARSFGEQWTRYRELQLDSRNGTTFSRDRFYSITEWRPEDLRGQLVLDAGCGAGRFTEIALAAGAEVVAVDLSVAVDAAARNLRANPAFHGVQASIYALPFASRRFDRVYCIGVVQHTPDPRATVRALAEQVRPGGALGLWVYEADWKSYVGTLGWKRALRPITKRMPFDTVASFAAALETATWPLVRRGPSWGLAGKALVRMLPVAAAHLHDVPLSDEDRRAWVRLDTLDMYSPAFDAPQRWDDVARWVRDAGLVVDPRHPHGAISLTARRP